MKGEGSPEDVYLVDEILDGLSDLPRHLCAGIGKFLAVLLEVGVLLASQWGIPVQLKKEGHLRQRVMHTRGQRVYMKDL